MDENGGGEGIRMGVWAAEEWDIEFSDMDGG
jgi:hypothetical protein